MGGLLGGCGAKGGDTSLTELGLRLDVARWYDYISRNNGSPKAKLSARDIRNIRDSIVQPLKVSWCALSRRGPS